MISSRVFDRVLLVEQGDRWRNAIVSRFGFRVPVDSVSMGELSMKEAFRYQIVAFEFSEKHLENGLSIFDKMDLSVENRFAILLGGPTDLSCRNIFRELGFVAFVDQVQELEQLERLFLRSKKRIQATAGWRSKLESQLPWSEFTTLNADFPRI